MGLDVRFALPLPPVVVKGAFTTPAIREAEPHCAGVSRSGELTWSEEWIRSVAEKFA